MTIVSVMRGVHDALAAAETLAAAGVDAEVIDLRSLRPLDHATVVESVRKTSRMVAVEEGPELGGWASGLVGAVAERALGDLDDVWTLTTPRHAHPVQPPARGRIPAGCRRDRPQRARAAGCRRSGLTGEVAAMGKTFGLNAVDWEQRVDVDRLRRQRLERIGGLLERSELGSLLCFDMVNIRYITATHIGTWAMDKLARFSLLARGAEPIVWDFGSAARHHELYCPWLEGRTPGRDLDDARGDVARERPGRGRGRQDLARARGARPADGAGRRRRGRAGRALRAAGARACRSSTASS